MRPLILLFFCFGCAASTEPEPLRCDSSVIGEGDGARLLIECTRDVDTPPPACVPRGESRYECNILHATAADCATFPGICS